MRFQVVIAGIGGQGTLFATKVFTEIARLEDAPVIGSENHGMSQRGGSVVSHLKLGAFSSPLVKEGDADLLLGLDALEAHRNLPFLRAGNAGPGALCVTNSPDPDAFPASDVAPVLERMDVRVRTCPADRIAAELGAPLTANLVVLGFASADERFPFPFERVQEALDAISAPPFKKPNLAALDKGRSLGEG